ncbi:MAG: SLC13 family permease [Gammaproteobacteria bacterium]
MNIKKSALYLAPPVALAAYFLSIMAGADHKVAATFAITLLTAIWWVTEALPIPATSLLPFAAFPLCNVLTHKEVALGLGNHVILLLMGGFMLAKSLEQCGLHRRFSLMMLNKLGGGGKRIVFAFIITAAFLSMWISNTATTLMLMPIGLGVLAMLDDKKLAIAVVLGIAYGASFGGIATLIGTPPNVIFAGVYQEFTQQEFGFLRWMEIGLPVVILGLPLMALWLTRNVSGKMAITLPATGSWEVDEKRVLVVFSLAVLFWITRSEPFGGWSQLLHIPGAGDSTVALAAVLLLFLIPSGKGGGLLTWKTASEIPWGMLLLFAGGITIAKAFMVSGLAELIGTRLTVLADLPLPLLILCICLCVTFLTEITSNVATTTLLMPILAAAAMAVNIPPEVMMIPAAMSASCAFMLPVATAPNAIAYGTDRVSMQEMMREGIVLNLIFALLITGVCHYTLG